MIVRICQMLYWDDPLYVVRDIWALIQVDPVTVYKDFSQPRHSWPTTKKSMFDLSPMVSSEDKPGQRLLELLENHSATKTCALPCNTERLFPWSLWCNPNAPILS